MMIHIYIHQPYPKALYAADGRTVVVADETEHAALEGEWAESPADFAAAEPEAAPENTGDAQGNASAEEAAAPGAAAPATEKKPRKTATKKAK